MPLVIQDRSFDDHNQLVYSSHMMQRMQGFLGDQIMINGQPDFILPVATRAYRLRLLNGSNSRIYKLAWDDGTLITVIGVDGGSALLNGRSYKMNDIQPDEIIPVNTLQLIEFDNAFSGGMQSGILVILMGLMMTDRGLKLTQSGYNFATVAERFSAP